MGEYFELTFFLEKETARKENAKEKIMHCVTLREGRNFMLRHEYQLFSNREVLFDVFEETDFYEYRFSISNITFSKSNFEETLHQLLLVVNSCFHQAASIKFATGIYELTYYNIAEINRLKEFDCNIFSKFPFLFFKHEYPHRLSRVKKYDSVSYIVQTGNDIQDIF